MIACTGLALVLLIVDETERPILSVYACECGSDRYDYAGIRCAGVNVSRSFVESQSRAVLASHATARVRVNVHALQVAQ
jgi:hypothetical protein